MDNIIQMFDRLGITVILDENEVMHFFNNDTQKELQTSYFSSRKIYNLSSMDGFGHIEIYDFDKKIVFSLNSEITGIEKKADKIEKKSSLMLDRISISRINNEKNIDNYDIEFSYDFFPNNFDINKYEFDDVYNFTPAFNNTNNYIKIRCKKNDDYINYTFYSNGLAFIKKNGYSISFDNGFKDETFLTQGDVLEIITKDDLLPIFVDYFAKIFPDAKKCLEYVEKNSKKLN